MPNLDFDYIAWMIGDIPLESDQATDISIADFTDALGKYFETIDSNFDMKRFKSIVNGD